MSSSLHPRSRQSLLPKEYSLDKLGHRQGAMRNFETVIGNNIDQFRSLQRGAPGLEYPARETTNATVQEVDPARLKLYSNQYQDYQSQAYWQQKKQSGKGRSLRDLRAHDIVGNKFMSRGLRNALNQDGHQMFKMSTIQAKGRGQFAGRSASHVQLQQQQQLLGSAKAERMAEAIMPDLVLPQMHHNKKILPVSKQATSKQTLQHDSLPTKAENSFSTLQESSSQRQQKLSLKHSMRSLERRTKNTTSLSQHKSDAQTIQTPITVTEQDKNSSSIFHYGGSELLQQDNKDNHSPQKYQVVSRNSVFVSRTTPIYKKEYGKNIHKNNQASIHLSKRSSSSIEIDELKQLLQNHKSVALNIQESRASIHKHEQAVLGQSSSLRQYATLPMKMGQKSAKAFNVKAYRKLAKNQQVKVPNVDQQYSRVVESYRPANDNEPTEIWYDRSLEKDMINVNFDLPSTKTVKGRSKMKENLSTIKFEDEIDQINSEKIELGSSNTGYHAGTGTQNQARSIIQKRQKGDSSFNTDLQMKISETPSISKPKVAEKVQQAKQVDPNDNFYATFSKIKNEKPNMFQPQQEVKIVGLDTLNYLGAKDADSQNPTPHLQGQNKVSQFFGQKRIESNSFNTNIPSTESLQILLVNRQKNAKAYAQSNTAAPATPNKTELNHKTKQQKEVAVQQQQKPSLMSTMLNAANDQRTKPGRTEQTSANDHPFLNARSASKNANKGNGKASSTPIKYKFKSPHTATKRQAQTVDKGQVAAKASDDEGSVSKSKMHADRSMFGLSSDESELDELLFQSFDKGRTSDDMSMNDLMIMKTFGHVPTPEKTENMLPTMEGSQLSRNKSDLQLHAHANTLGESVPYASHSGLTASSKQLAIASQHIESSQRNKKAVQEVLNGKYLLPQAEVDQIEEHKYNINKIIKAYGRKQITASKNMDKLSQLTSRQNLNTNVLIKNIESNQDFKNMVEFQGGSTNAAKDMNKEFLQIIQDSEMKKSQINFRLLGQTSKEMKQVMQKAQKVVCNQENFHTQVQIANASADGQQHPLLNKIELCRSSQVNIKVGVKGHHSPLRLKIDYCDVGTGQVMTKPQLLQLKGFFDVYVSKKHRNPQPALDPKEPSTATFETSYINQMPPRIIEIHSNEQHVPMVPFLQNWAYITIDCGEHALLDDVQLVIKATTAILNANQAQMNQSSNSFYSDEDDLEEKARQAQLAKERRAKNQKHSLFEFKKETRNEINNLIDDAGEWEDFQEQLKLSKKRMKNKSKRTLQDVFLTTLGDEGESVSAIGQLSPDAKLKQLLLAGDFVTHNQLSIQLKQHHKQGKINKINQMADKQKQLKDQLDKKNQDNAIEFMKRKVFLSHYNAILKYQKGKKDQEEYEIDIMRNRVASWLKLMMINKHLGPLVKPDAQGEQQTNKTTKGLIGHYLAKKKIQDHQRWMQLCVSRVSARLKWILRKKGKSYAWRRVNDIKQVMSLRAVCASYVMGIQVKQKDWFKDSYWKNFKRSLWSDQLQPLQQDEARKSSYAIVLDYLKHSAEVQDIVDKVGFHAEWVMKLQAIYRCYRQRKLDSLERMKEDWDKAQNYLVAKLANSKVSDQKKAENMTKLQIYRSVGSKIKDEFCDQYLYYKKLMFQLLDTYKLRERYVQEHLAQSSKSKSKTQMTQGEANGSDDKEEKADEDQVDDAVEQTIDRDVKDCEARLEKSQKRLKTMLLRAEELNKTMGLALVLAMKALTANEENLLANERISSPKALQSERKSEKATERSKTSTKGDKPKKQGSKKAKPVEVIEEKTVEERITELGVDLNDEVPSFVLYYADNNEMRKLVDQGVFHLQQRQKQAELDALALVASRKEALRKQQEQEEEEKAEQEHQESPTDKKEDKPEKPGAPKEKKQEKQ